ncbi:hypothetical protein Tco_1158179 [Tanacetum coccineum]
MSRFPVKGAAIYLLLIHLLLSHQDGGDDGDDNDGDSSGDDADDKDEDEEEEDEDEEDEEEEEEHLASADSAVVVPTVESVSPPEGTAPVIPPPLTLLPLELGLLSGFRLPYPFH